MTTQALLSSTKRIAILFILAAILSSLYWLGVRVAHADAATTATAATPASSGLDVVAIFAVLGTVLGGLSLLLSGASVVLHAIAAKTTNKVDDAVADGIDKFRTEVVRVLGILGVKEPTDTTLREAANPQPKAPESGRVLLPVIITLAMGGVIGTAAMGCDGLKSAGAAVIDCTKANQPAIEALILEFRPLLQGDAPNWSAVESKAIAAGEVIGGCALVQVVTEVSGKRSALAASNAGKATLEDFRAKYANGATFRTAGGDM